MPSKPSLTLPNAFTLIVESGNLTDPTIRFRNTWDIHATVQPQPSDAIISAILDFHLGNLRTDCGVFMATLRNWSQGPQPFASRPFLWETTVGPVTGLKTAASPAGYGGEAVGNQSIPGSAVLFCKRQTAGGNKQTNLFLRGLLDEVDIIAETGGRYVFTAGPNVTPGKFTALVGHTLAPYIGSALNPGLIIVHVGNKGAGPAFSSPITGVQLIQPSENKMTRKNRR
jgi:hypothetical protein